MSEETKIKVEMTVFDWHKLLKELEFRMSFVGDRKVPEDLYEQIATQLSSGKEFIFSGSEKHQRLDPEGFKKTQEERNKKELEVKKEESAQKDFWDSFFNKKLF